MATYKAFTQAEREEFAGKCDATRDHHAALVDVIIDALKHGTLTLSDDAPDELGGCIAELYQLNNTKVPDGIRPSGWTPQLTFEIAKKR